MKKEMNESISRYVELYDAIQEKTGNDEVTAVIFQEIGFEKLLNLIQLQQRVVRAMS